MNGYTMVIMGRVIVLHFLLGIACYMGREWKPSFRLGMRPWIAIAYSAPVAAATTVVFLIYPIGQGSCCILREIGILYFHRFRGHL